jgi:serine/threonine-protein kinase
MSTFEERLRTALLPSYEIERELTGAGMSRVFVATDVGLGRQIVIKVLPPELTAGVNRDRFRREIQVAAQLQHPHIVTLLSAGENEELLYYTMPFIEGESLRVALEKGPLSVKDVVRILHDVVDALAYAHARGVIHRDIKPGNILKLGSHALVTDFGVAKALNAAMPATGVTTSGMAIGTPAYMAPEQLAGDPAADHRMDIYAVGLLAYELLTGESPFTGPSPQATLAAQLTRDPEPLYKCCPDVPQPLSAIIMQCLAKEPSQRPPTAEALMTALDSITSSSGEIKTAATKVLPAVENRRRRMTIGVGVGTIALGCAAALYASQRSSEASMASVEAGAAASVSAAALPTPPKTPEAPKPAVAAPIIAPIALTRADSLAIAEAVRKRLAQEEASKGTKHVMMVADSITAYVRKSAIDSIIRAALPKGALQVMPTWSEMGPNVARAFGGKRRLVITEPRASRNNELNAFGKMLADSLRRAFSKRAGYSVVDGDSVNAVLSVSRARPEVEAALKPDAMITPTFVGMGDTMTVILTLRDLRAGPAATRTVSGRFAVANPGPALGVVVGGVVGQMESLTRSPTFYKVGQPPQVPRGINER